MCRNEFLGEILINKESISYRITDVVKDLAKVSEQLHTTTTDVSVIGEDVETMKGNVAEITLATLGEAVIEIPSSSAGWQYNSLPTLHKSQQYQFTLSLKEPSATPIYWRVTQGDKTLVLDQIIGEGQSTGAASYVADGDYNDAVLAIYTDTGRPSMELSLATSQPTLIELGDGISRLSAELNNTIFERGNISWDGSEVDSASVSRTNYIPCKKGDIFKGYIYVLHKFDKNLQYLGEVALTPAGTDYVEYTLSDANCAFVRLMCRNEFLGEILINGVSLSYNMVDYTIGRLAAPTAIRPDLNDANEIIMPIPQLAKVNLIAPYLPTTKTEDVHAVMEFDDGRGNVFRKNIILNAQGTSSLGLPKKHFSIDIVDSDYNNSHSIKFGTWVMQDSFHLKAYLLDGLRVKPIAAYDLYESILLTRPIREDRVWKRLQLPPNIPDNSNAISEAYLQIDDGAKCHPAGFPIILSVNGEFYGIYCWQLKKHRANYHQKKSNANHIHLDGNISNILLWNAGGNINWDKWAGKEYESSDILNNEGIEVRNPKKLILVDGSEYDGETNSGELISASSPNYNANNADMVRTAAVRANIERLSRRVTEISQMTKSEAKKSALAEVFDIASIIDYIIFGQITANVDGYKKNWQWVTYDGIKWAVNAYDLDSVWGWNGVGYVPQLSWWYTGDAIPAQMVIENYEAEIKERYAELRKQGVLDLHKIMTPLAQYVKSVGFENYEKEFEKWTEGVRDNLWRFEVWMEESIRLTDILMDYNKAA